MEDIVKPKVEQLIHKGLSPDGKSLITTGFRTARLWDVETGEALEFPISLNHRSDTIDIAGPASSNLHSRVSYHLRCSAVTLDVGNTPGIGTSINCGEYCLVLFARSPERGSTQMSVRHQTLVRNAPKGMVARACRSFHSYHGP